MQLPGLLKQFSHLTRVSETHVTDPFYEKKKGRSRSSFLSFDSWVDSSLYETFQAIGVGYQRFGDFYVDISSHRLSAFAC